ncbi:MAG TPA: prepilin-type N-terminal cleavage/methylation domain-containing protein [Acidimicrobiia bacterium]|nr:prepilin-type N-terminal cleavage/methylation domain-containing protein [Acidimicrobiia bacterium]
MTTPKVVVDERGFTLSEVLIAVVILGVAITALLGSLSSVLYTSRAHRNLATADSGVRAYAEQLQAASYARCASVTGAGAYPAMTNMPAAFSVTITKVEYGDVLTGSNPTDAFSTTQSQCQTGVTGDGTPYDTGVERITIVAHPFSGPGSQTLQIVKRNPVETS